MRPARLPVSDLKECPHTVVNISVIYAGMSSSEYPRVYNSVIQVPTSKVNSCRVSPQGQIGEYGNDRPLSICNVQAKGTVFSSLVAEVLNQIAKKRVIL